jgi:hypothetical protein
MADSKKTVDVVFVEFQADLKGLENALKNAEKLSSKTVDKIKNLFQSLGSGIKAPEIPTPKLPKVPAGGGERFGPAAPDARSFQDSISAIKSLYQAGSLGAAKAATQLEALKNQAIQFGQASRQAGSIGEAEFSKIAAAAAKAQVAIQGINKATSLPTAPKASTESFGPPVPDAKALQQTVNTVRNLYQAGSIGAQETIKQLSTLKQQAAAFAAQGTQFAGGTAELLKFAQAAAQAERTISGINGEMSRLGLATQVKLAIDSTGAAGLKKELATATAEVKRLDALLQQTKASLRGLSSGAGQAAASDIAKINQAAAAAKANVKSLQAELNAISAKQARNAADAIGDIGLAIGAGGAVLAAREFTRESAQAIAQASLFDRVLKKFGSTPEAGSKAVEELSGKFGVLKTSVQESLTTLLRQNLSLEASVKILKLAGSSALFAGKSAEDGFKNVAGAVASQLSALLNSIGIAENFGSLFTKLEKRTEGLTQKQKQQAKSQELVNFFIKAAGDEYANVDPLLKGYLETLNKLNLTFGEFRQAVGLALEPVFSIVNKALSLVLSVFKNLPKELQSALAIFGLATSAALALTAAYGLLGPAINAARVALVGFYSTALAPLAPVLAGVTAALAAFYLAYKTNFLGIRDITDKVLAFIRGSLAEAPIYFRGVASALGEMGKIFGEVFSGIRKILLGFALNAKEFLVKPIVDFARSLASFFAPIVQAFQQWVAGIIKTLKPLADVLSATGSALGNTIKNAIKSLQEGVADKLKSTFANLGKGIEDANKPVQKLSEGTKLITEGLGDITGAALNAGSRVKKAFSDAVEEAKKLREETKKNEQIGEVFTEETKTGPSEKELKQSQALQKLTSKFNEQLTEANRDFALSLKDNKVSAKEILGFTEKIRDIQREAKQAGVALDKESVKYSRTLVEDSKKIFGLNEKARKEAEKVALERKNKDLLAKLAPPKLPDIDLLSFAATQKEAYDVGVLSLEQYKAALGDVIGALQNEYDIATNKGQGDTIKFLVAIKALKDELAQIDKEAIEASEALARAFAVPYEFSIEGALEESEILFKRGTIGAEEFRKGLEETVAIFKEDYESAVLEGAANTGELLKRLVGAEDKLGDFNKSLKEVSVSAEAFAVEPFEFSVDEGFQAALDAFDQGTSSFEVFESVAKSAIGFLEDEIKLLRKLGEDVSEYEKRLKKVKEDLSKRSSAPKGLGQKIAEDFGRALVKGAPILNDVLEAASSGGLVGAFVSLVANSEAFSRILAVVNPLLQTVADTAGAFLEPLIPIISVLSLGITPALKALSSIIVAILLPVFKALFPVIKSFGIVLTSVAIVMAEAFNVLARAIKIITFGSIDLTIDTGPLYESFKAISDATFDQAEGLAKANSALKKEALSLPDNFRQANYRLQSAVANSGAGDITKRINTGASGNVYLTVQGDPNPNVTTQRVLAELDRRAYIVSGVPVTRIT